MYFDDFIFCYLDSYHVTDPDHGYGKLKIQIRYIYFIFFGFIVNMYYVFASEEFFWLIFSGDVYTERPKK